MSPAESHEPDGTATQGARSHYRPADLTPGELGFTRRRPVPWLAPGQLTGTAVRVLGAELFGAILDKRELQAALPSRVHDHSDGDELWFDYVADIGDGFNATYSMAWLLGQATLTVPGPDDATRTLPRGQLLVMGGDEVYPTPSRQGYEDRSNGPYHAALPPGASGKTPVLYALPGNHDWYDGLTAFLRLFAKGSRFGGWRTQQTRSYFALSLPHRWWLFAIDESLDAYLDDPQLRYFRQAAENLAPGDRVILCTSRPSWVYAARQPHAYDTPDYFIRKIIAPTGASVPVLLTGDLHHYARYEHTGSSSPAGQQPAGTGAPDAAATTPAGPATAGPTADPAAVGPASAGPDGVRADRAAAGGAGTDRVEMAGTGAGGAALSAQGDDGAVAEMAPPQMLITCGGGGAYLYPTHRLPPALSAPPVGPHRRDSSPPAPYELVSTFPSRADSRQLGWGIFGRLLGRNAGFAAVLGVLHTLLMYAFITCGHRILTAPVLTLGLLVLGSTIAFAMSEVDVHRRAAHWISGVAHGCAQLGLGVLGAWAWWSLPLVHLPGPLPVLLSALIYLPVAGVVAAELTALYLLVASYFHVNVDELFAAQGIEDRKSFLRLHLDGDGRLTIYPIGLTRAGRRWAATPGAPAGSPWIAPGTPLRTHLIEAPLVIDTAAQDS